MVPRQFLFLLRLFREFLLYLTWKVISKEAVRCSHHLPPPKDNPGRNPGNHIIQLENGNSRSFFPKRFPAQTRHWPRLRGFAVVSIVLSCM